MSSLKEMSLKSTSNWILPKEKIDDGDIAGYVISKRGFDKGKFLNPSLDDIPSFKYMYDSSNAAKSIVNAVKSKERIVIHGDFTGIKGSCITNVIKFQNNRSELQS